MRRRLLAAAAATTALAAALTACGTTQEAESEAAPEAKQIVLKDATGASVTLDGPATKVVGTEWGVVENLVSLGVAPVGVADVKGYGLWSSAVPLRNKPKDIGTRGEPSIDTVASLSPDLVVATTDLPTAAIKQLKKVAPVLVVRPAKASDQIAQMTGNLDLVAQATGREKQAAEVERSFRDKVAAGKAELEKAGLGGAKVAFADGYLESNQVGIRPYTTGSLIGSVTAELGLADAWKLKGDQDYGLAATDVEGLTKVGDAHFVYLVNDGDGGDPFSTVLGKNAVWKSLPFVKKGEVSRLPDGIWMFGGPASMEAYVDALVAALTK